MSQVKISSIEGNRQRLDGGAMFGNAPRAVWQKWCPPDELGRIELACRCFLVQVDEKRILLETGIGAFFEPSLSERYGVQNPKQHQLLEHLSQLGFHEDDIDFVILSHLHFDHAGGLLPTYDEMKKVGAKLNFPKARYLVGRQAWERALRPHSRDRASFIPELVDSLESCGRLQIVDENQPSDLPACLSFFTTDGHTPGQLHTRILGHECQAIFCGDLVPGTAWVHKPITMGYDRFPEKLIDEKAQFYASCEGSLPSLLLYTHDARVAAGYLAFDEKGRYYSKDNVQNLKDFRL